MGLTITFPTADELRACINYDPKTGGFWWAKKGRGIRFGHAAGTLNKSDRREICVLGRRHKAARLAWVLVYGIWPAGVIDHINGDPSDDRIENLRDVSHKENRVSVICC